jgi:hypothetical protein
MGKNQDLGLGSRFRMKNQDHISESLDNIFFGLKYRHQPSIAKKKPPPFKKGGNGGAKRLSPEDQAAMDESGLCW